MEEEEELDPRFERFYREAECSLCVVIFASGWYPFKASVTRVTVFGFEPYDSDADISTGAWFKSLTTKLLCGFVIY